MAMQLNPDAAFDCMFIANRLQRDDEAITRADLHLFGYLACLLWLYRRHTLSDWGYSFVATEHGAPFSLDIDATIWEFLERGHLIRVQDRLRLPGEAQDELAKLLGLSLNADRAECLLAACSSTSALSTGMVATALSQEPELRRARTLPANRALLEETAQSQIYEQFEILQNALNQEIDLRVPAVVWLDALYKSGDSTLE